MNKNNAIITGLGAMLALVISLPLEWMTIHNAKVQFSGGFERMSSLFGPITVRATGFNCQIPFLAKLPIWLVVVVGLIGVLLAFLNRVGATSLPKFVPLIPLSLSAVCVVVVFLVTVVSSESTVGIGFFVALIGFVLGYVHALGHQIAPQES